ncbi:MAG: MarR family winged helix-turn-helix transcriptional regulator [Candidatus Dormibacteraceae bacterium]
MAVETGADLQVAETLNSLATIILRRPSSGLSLTASGTLSLLGRVGPLRITELAGRMRVSQPSMTELVIRLERTRLVRRTRDREDGRVVLVELTEPGRALRDTVRGERATYLAGLLARLDSGQRAALAAAVPAIDRLVGVASESLATEESEGARRV